MSDSFCWYHVRFVVATILQLRTRVAGTNPVFSSSFDLGTSAGHHIRKGSGAAMMWPADPLRTPVWQNGQRTNNKEAGRDLEYDSPPWCRDC